MKRLLGGILLGIGILLMGASGLCTGAFVVMALFSGNLTDGLGMIPLGLAVGIVPFGIGLGIYYGGRALIRAADRDEA